MKVIVTGGAGFIGSHIVEELLNQHHEVIVLDDLSSGKQKNLPKNSLFYHITIGKDLVGLEGIFREERPDVVIHHAAQVSVSYSLDHPIEDLETNTLGTLHLLHCCKQYNVKKIIFASSAAVYGDLREDLYEGSKVEPLSFYGLSKLTAEKYIQLYGNLHDLNYTILRYANVYGPGQNPKGEAGVISIFCETLKSGRGFSVFGDGTQTRDFVYVKDVAKANVMALTKGNNEVINISSGIRTSVLEIIALFNTITRQSLTPIFTKKRIGEIQHSLLKNNHAQEVLGWIPQYSLLTGLTETIEFASDFVTHQEL